MDCGVVMMTLENDAGVDYRKLRVCKEGHFKVIMGLKLESYVTAYQKNLAPKHHCSTLKLRNL